MKRLIATAATLLVTVILMPHVSESRAELQRVQTYVEISRSDIDPYYSVIPDNGNDGTSIEPDRDIEAEIVPELIIPEPEAEYISLGVFRVTAYCSCESCCGKWAKFNKTASGTTPTAGRTIAVSKAQIPFGTSVLIDGHEYTAEDTGSAIKENCIDIYMSSHSEAIEFGVQYKEVKMDGCEKSLD